MNWLIAPTLMVLVFTSNATSSRRPATRSRAAALITLFTCACAVAFVVRDTNDTYSKRIMFMASAVCVLSPTGKVFRTVSNGMRIVQPMHILYVLLLTCFTVDSALAFCNRLYTLYVYPDDGKPLPTLLLSFVALLWCTQKCHINYLRQQLDIEHEKMRMASIYTGRPATRAGRERAVQYTSRLHGVFNKANISRNVAMDISHDDRAIIKQLRPIYTGRSAVAQGKNAEQVYTTVVRNAPLMHARDVVLFKYIHPGVVLRPLFDGFVTPDIYVLQHGLSAALGMAPSVLEDAYDAAELMIKTKAYIDGSDDPVVTKQRELHKVISDATTKNPYLTNTPPLGPPWLSTYDLAKMYVTNRVQPLVWAWVWFVTTPYKNLTCTSAPLMSALAMKQLAAQHKPYSSKALKKNTMRARDRQSLQWYSAAHKRMINKKSDTRRILQAYAPTAQGV